MHAPVRSRLKSNLTIAPRALTSSAVRENLTGPMEMPSLGSPAALHPATETEQLVICFGTNVMHMHAIGNTLIIGMYILKSAQLLLTTHNLSYVDMVS